LVKESFSLSGIWTLCSIEPVSSQQFNFLEISRDVMIKTLINLSEGTNKAKDGGYYAPIFSFNDCKDNVQDELKALQSQHGNRIAPPVFYDQRAGLISLQNSQNMTGGGNK
jgi:hypothetical protein